MKKIVLIALLFAGLSTTGFAQEKLTREKRSPEERAQHITEALSKKLSLSESQKNEIYKINLERAKELEKRHAASEKKHLKDKSETIKLFEASDNKINNVLNEEQRKAYAQLKSERKDKMKEHKGEFRKKRNERSDSK